MGEESRRLDRSDACFDTTRWSLVDRVNEADAAGRAAALAELCARYWPPVYAYLRRSGRGREAAAELTQGFFTDVVVWRELFEQADRRRGHLRSLVLTALKRYVVDAHRRGAARGAGQAMLSRLEEEDALLESSAHADAAFDRRWALALVQRALAVCEAHYAAAGKRGHWALFEQRDLAEARGLLAVPLETAAPACGFASAAAGRAALQVVRDRLTAILREESLVSGEDGPGLAAVLGVCS